MESTARPRSTGRFLVLAAAMLALAVLSQQSWAAAFRGTAKSALAPLEAQMMPLATAAEHATAIFGDIASLRDQNQRLTADNQDLRRQLAELNAAAYDNNELRKALDFQRSISHPTAVTQEIGLGPDAASPTLQIDLGRNAGVQASTMTISAPAPVGPARA